MWVGYCLACKKGFRFQTEMQAKSAVCTHCGGKLSNIKSDTPVAEPVINDTVEQQPVAVEPFVSARDEDGSVVRSLLVELLCSIPIVGFIVLLLGVLRGAGHNGLLAKAGIAYKAVVGRLIWRVLGDICFVLSYLALYRYGGM